MATVTKSITLTTRRGSTTIFADQLLKDRQAIFAEQRAILSNSGYNEETARLDKFAREAKSRIIRDVLAEEVALGFDPTPKVQVNRGPHLKFEALDPVLAVASLTARIDLLDEAVAEPFDIAPYARALLSRLRSLSPVDTGNYADSFGIIFNGKFVSDIPQTARGRSIIRIYNKANYASPLEALKYIRGGGIMHAAAMAIQAANPLLKVAFYYAKATAGNSQRGRYPQDPAIYIKGTLYNKAGEAKIHAVPVIAIGGPNSRMKSTFDVPGRNKRRGFTRGSRIKLQKRRGSVHRG